MEFGEGLRNGLARYEKVFLVKLSEIMMVKILS
jgi:hypothetical protein